MFIIILRHSFAAAFLTISLLLGIYTWRHFMVFVKRLQFWGAFIIFFPFMAMSSAKQVVPDIKGFFPFEKSLESLGLIFVVIINFGYEFGMVLLKFTLLSLYPCYLRFYKYRKPVMNKMFEEFPIQHKSFLVLLVMLLIWEYFLYKGSAAQVYGLIFRIYWLKRVNDDILEYDASRNELDSQTKA